MRVAAFASLTLTGPWPGASLQARARACEAELLFGE